MLDVFNNTVIGEEWSLFIEKVIQSKPEEITTSLEQALRLLNRYRFSAEIATENDSSTTLSLKEIDLIVNEPNLDLARTSMAKELIAYSHDYFHDFQLYNNAPNRKGHFPYVLKVALLNNLKEISDLIDA